MLKTLVAALAGALMLVAAPQAGPYTQTIAATSVNGQGYGLLIENDKDEDLRFGWAVKSGKTGNARKYGAFLDKDDNGWLIGSNGGNAFILFNGYNGHHPIVGEANGILHLSGGAGQAVRFNSQPGATGEAEWYSGGADPEKFFTVDPINGLLTWGRPMRARSADLSKWVEMDSDNGLGRLHGNQPIAVQVEGMTAATFRADGLALKPAASATPVTGELMLTVSGDVLTFRYGASGGVKTASVTLQ